MPFGFRTKKSPDQLLGPGMPFSILSFLLFMTSIHEGLRTIFNSNQTGRSSGFRIVLLAVPSHLYGQWHLYGFRSRLQRRVRNGL